MSDLYMVSHYSNDLPELLLLLFRLWEGLLHLYWTVHQSSFEAFCLLLEYLLISALRVCMLY